MSICLRCWEEASRRHLLHGEGESVTAVYGRLIDANWCSVQGGEIDLMKALEHSLQMNAPAPVEGRTESKSGAGNDPEPPSAAHHKDE